MKHIVIFAVFICILQVTFAAKLSSLSPLEIYKETTTFGSTTEKPSNLSYCSKPGFLCKTCTELVKCIEIEPGIFEENLIQTCSNDETCLIDRCSSDPNPKCEGTDYFTCTATGTFPDPYDCQIYHVCIKSEDIIIPEGENRPVSDVHEAVNCKGDFGYNYHTTLCEKQLDNGNCPTSPPIPVCLTLGQSAGLEETSYYYVCVEINGKLRPVMHVCPHGTRLNESSICA